MSVCTIQLSGEAPQTGPKATPPPPASALLTPSGKRAKVKEPESRCTLGRRPQLVQSRLRTA